MKKKFHLFLTLTVFFVAPYLHSQGIKINEVMLMPCNGIIIADQGPREYIEIINTSCKSVDVAGWYLRTELSNNITNPIVGDDEIVAWDTRYPGVAPFDNVPGPLLTNSTILPPGAIAVILPPTWNTNTTSNLWDLPDNVILLTVRTHNLWATHGAGLNALLANKDDFVVLYNGVPSLPSSSRVDSVAWTGPSVAAQMCNYSLQRDDDGIFRFHNSAFTSPYIGYNKDTDNSLFSPISIGAPNHSSAVAVNPVVASSSVSNLTCNGNNSGVITATVTGGSTAYTYSWNNGFTGAIATGLAAGTYSFVVTDSLGCGDTVAITVAQPSPLMLHLSSSTVICAGQNYSITTSVVGGVSNYAYNWATGETTASITVYPTQQATYKLTVTDNNGCTVTDSVVVGVNELPAISFTCSDTMGCAPVCINFENTTPNTTSAVWTFSPGNWQAGELVSNCYTTAGVYDAILEVTDNNGCSNTLIKNNLITIFPKPLAAYTANPQQTTALNPTINFTNQSLGHTSSTWSFGDVASGYSFVENPSYTYTDTGRYSVELIVSTDDGCSDTAVSYIIIAPEYSFYIPNSFTPNGDGTNDVFLPKESGTSEDGYALLIYDRWGQLLFETNNINEGWNGFVLGSNIPAQIDTYVWMVNRTDRSGNKIRQAGHVNLIR